MQKITNLPRLSPILSIFWTLTSATFQGRLTVSGPLQVLQEILQSLAVKEDFEIIKE